MKKNVMMFIIFLIDVGYCLLVSHLGFLYSCFANRKKRCRNTLYLHATERKKQTVKALDYSHAFCLLKKYRLILPLDSYN